MTTTKEHPACPCGLHWGHTGKHMPEYITIDYGAREDYFDAAIDKLRHQKESPDINHRYHPAFYILLGLTTGITLILLLALYVNLKI